MQEVSPEFYEPMPLGPKWRQWHWSVWLGYLLGIAATVGYTILAYVATLSTGIAYLPFLLSGVVFLANVRIFAIGSAKALKLLFDFDDTARLFKGELQNWNMGSTLRMLLILAAVVLFVSAGFALGVTVYSAVIGLGFPLFLSVGLSLATFASVSLTMWLGFTIMVTTPLSRYKEIFKQLFYPDEDLTIGGRKAWSAYILKLAIVLTFITLGITLGILAAVAPLTMMHAAGVDFLAKFALVKTAVLANSVCNLVVYGFAGAIRVIFSVVGVAGFTGRWGMWIANVFTRPRQAWDALKQWYQSRFKSVKAFFKNFIWNDAIGFVKDSIDSASGLLFYVPTKLYWVAPAAIVSTAMSGYGELESYVVLTDYSDDEDADGDKEHTSTKVLGSRSGPGSETGEDDGSALLPDGSLVPTD